MPDRRYADEWLPSRFSLATLQLIAYVVARGLERSRPTSGAHLNREAHQHPLEAYLLAVAYWIIPTLQFGALEAAGFGWGWLGAAASIAALLVLVPLGWVLVALVFTPVARALSRWSGRPTHDIQALVTPSGMLVIAVVSIVRQWPGAPLGWLWVTLTAIEILASLACVALRGRFAALDARLPAEAP